jgi:glucokinase
MKNYYIGIDIGGTNAPASIVNGEGKILKLIDQKTLSEGGPDKVISRIIESIKELINWGKSNLDSEIKAVGIGAPGTIRNGKVITSPNLPNWRDIPIVEIIKKQISIPVELDNDANCAALAEHWIGEAKGKTNAILITLGTGIGGGIIINNEVYRGSHGTAGELGHITIVNKGTKCACGNFGCLEAYASANATLSRVKEKLKREDIDSSLNNKKLSELTTYDIFLAAEDGDRFSQKSLNETGMYLGIGIATLSNIFDPDIILIGGGFSDASKYLIPSAIEEAYRRSFKSVMDNIEIKRAKLGNQAGIIGAAALAKNSI